MTNTTQASVIRAAFDSLLTTINTGLPARVERVHPEKRQVDVQPLLKTKAGGVLQSRPIIPNVPLVMASGGGLVLSMPVEKGDLVWLAFSQRSMDRWLASSGGEVDPAHGRKFHISDAIAFPGLFPTSGAPELDGAAYLGTVDGEAGVRVHQSGKISIGNSTSDLLDLVKQLGDETSAALTTISSGVIVPAGAAWAFNPATITAIGVHNTKIMAIMAQLSTIKI